MPHHWHSTMNESQSRAKKIHTLTRSHAYNFSDALKIRASIGNTTKNTKSSQMEKCENMFVCFFAFVFFLVFWRFHGDGVAIIIVGIVVTLNIAFVNRVVVIIVIVVVIDSNESLSFYSQQTNAIEWHYWWCESSRFFEAVVILPCVCTNCCLFYWRGGVYENLFTAAATLGHGFATFSFSNINADYPGEIIWKPPSVCTCCVLISSPRFRLTPSWLVKP